MDLVLTAAARADLNHIADWIARDNPLRAITFIDEIEAHCHGICEMPLAYPLLPGRERSGLRRVVHGNYLVFYRSDRRRVVALRIIHGARDFEAILFPNE